MLLTLSDANMNKLLRGVNSKETYLKIDPGLHWTSDELVL